MHKIKPSVSITIITKNSENTIEKCLQSLAFADEIIVLDSGSTDETLTLCRKYTDQVFQTDWPGFGPQKNRALEKATSDWVFSIDSDEWISDASRDEIIRTIQTTPHTAFIMPRLNQYCGKWIRFGDAGKDTVMRLFKRGCAQFSNDIVHEKLIADHKTLGQLKHALLHNSYQSVDAIMERMNRYTTLSAQARFARGKKTSVAKTIFSSAWAFFRSYIFRYGFLDGKMGFVVAISSAESSYYRHIKLLELQKKLS